MIRIALLSLMGTCDYWHIGGMESIVRRLADALVDRGDELTLVQYGAGRNSVAPVRPGLAQMSFDTLEHALDELKSGYDHVMSLYLRPRDRIGYAAYRRKHNDSIRFHHLYSVWHESRLRREMLLAEARLAPFNGQLLCVSPRIHRSIVGWARRSAVLLPPVSQMYFCDSDDKSNGGRLRVTYAGRLDSAKGAHEAIEVFKRLAGRDDVETRVCGYVWAHDGDTTQVWDALTRDSCIRRDLAEQRKWSPSAEEGLRDILRHTDILLLPYQRLSSTVDMPLLLLEGMASLCAVVTPKLGSLHEIYGPSCFNLRGGWNQEEAIGLIQSARPHIQAERNRLWQRNQTLRFTSGDIARVFREVICAAD